MGSEMCIRDRGDTAAPGRVVAALLGSSITLRSPPGHPDGRGYPGEDDTPGADPRHDQRGRARPPAVVERAELAAGALQVAREIMAKSPTAIRMLKFAFNLADDGLMGQQVFAGEATRLAYMTDEAVEGRDSFLEKRPPNWDQFPYYY